MTQLVRGNRIIDVPENKVAYYLHVGYKKVEKVEIKLPVSDKKHVEEVVIPSVPKKKSILDQTHWDKKE